MFRTALRTVLAQRARLTLTALSVLLGVAFVSGVLVFGDTAVNAERAAVDKSAGDASVVISTNRPAGADAGLGRALLRRTETLPGVASARASVSGHVAVDGKNGQHLYSVAGNYSPGKDGSDPAYRMVEGRPPARSGETAMTRTAATAAGYRLGDTVPVTVGAGQAGPQKLVGLYAPAAGRTTGPALLFSTDAAQRLLLSPGRYSQISLTATPDVSDQQLLAQVQPLIAQDSAATVQTGSSVVAGKTAQAEENIKPLTNILLACAGLALFVSTFIIANTFTMLVGQRTRELALFRAVGATRRQVKGSVLAEALLVGTAASLCGVPLGIGLSVLIRAGISAAGADMPAGPLIVTPVTVLLSLGIGILVTVLAAWLPARRAAKIAPVAAMSSIHTPPTPKSLAIRNILGAVLAAVGAGIVTVGAGIGNAAGGRVITGGAVLMLLGMIVLTPFLSRPVIGLARKPLERFLPVTGPLACGNAVQNPRRTGATASAVSIGVTMVSGMAVFAASLQHDIDGKGNGGTSGPIIEILTGMFVMTLVIAVVGVVNTLTISVFERRREIGLLRALGMDRTGVRQTIRIEALVISVLGSVLGVGMGVFLGWAITQAAAMELVIPWGKLALFFAAAALVGLGAAAAPARRASRLNALAGIKSE
ncbi:ABC transporter permease [Streptomyces sp. NBC_01264]|uniref:ABC transporter permease n=1 Tax=Streptomyces sp. NBC_01264 TaxID=2903804 RepID=UPI00224DA48B|nr:FtsX-like permease family protein [Streptomyces sp. NBC_01264]MCX4783597.1 FtsX-like permease family protein [Streptomyces sp. NBC_01264]